MKNGLEAYGIIQNFIRTAKTAIPEIVDLLIAESQKEHKTVLRSGRPANVRQGRY